MPLISSRRARRRTCRLFSLTSIPGKLNLENIFRHMKDKNMIVSSQYEFTTRKTSLTNLITIPDELIGLVDKRRTVDPVRLLTLSSVKSDKLISMG